MRKIMVVLLLAGVLLSGSLAALAQSGFDLSWWSVDGGSAATSAGGGYELRGAIGQPDAGRLSAGSFVLDGGFWGGGALAATEYRIYLPLALRAYG